MDIHRPRRLIRVAAVLTLATASAAAAPAVAQAATRPPITTNEDGMSWGTNTYGQLGVANPTASASPVQIDGLSRVVAIAAGAGFGMAMEKRGTVSSKNYVYTWGQDTDGTRGDGEECLCEYLAVWDWGNNDFGQLGIGTDSLRAPRS